MLDRHEALRTTLRFPAGPGAPALAIGDAPIEPLETAPATADLNAVRAADRAAIDAESGPPFLARLVPTGGARHLLVLTAAALAADLPSLRVVARDLVHAYAGTLTDAPLQYADFAAYHEEILADPEFAAERSGWEDRLEAAGGGGDSSSPERERRAVPVELPGACSRGVLGAAWGTVLWRTAGERKLVVGAVCPGRSQTELAAAVGAYEREAPVPIRLDSERRFAAAAAELDTTLDDAAETIDSLDPARVAQDAPGGLPHRFAYRYAFEPVRAAGLRMTAVEERGEDGGGALALVCGDGGRSAAIVHDPVRIPNEEADALARRLGTLLVAAIAAPDTPVGSLPLLDAAERARLLRAGAGPRAERAGASGLHQLVEAEAASTPEAIAAEYAGEELTYVALDDRAGRLATRLREAGAGPGERVAVVLRRSLELPVALLAALKSGAAYVPIDAAQPPRRVAALLDAARPCAVVCHEPTRHLAEAARAGVAVLDAAETSAHPASTSAAAGEDLAYVMFTSGTTGAPKGVMVPHRALVNYVSWCADAYRLREGRGCLVHSPVAFDLTVTTLLAPLVVGQRTILLAEDAGMAGLAAALREGNDLTLVKLTPTHLRVLADLLDGPSLAGSVRTLVVGGEDLRGRHLRMFAEQAPDTRIVNEYGPTETCVGSTAFAVPAGAVDSDDDRVPIGTAIANTRVHVADARGEPVPDGVSGELLIGGDGVAAGYLGDTELTAERFVADPFGELGRLYRSGDRARRRPDGVLEYLGRLDDQVKIAGVRVEPAEVARTLTDHPAVREAVVIARENPSDGPSPVLADLRLVAYVVPRAGAGDPTPASAPNDLLAHCRERLPAALVPAAIVLLERLPTTPNGKLDRAALPAAGTGIINGRPAAPPRTSTEQELASAISTVLGVERVGVDDDYFVLGGDSIRSIMVVSRLRERGLELSVADLHAHPTVRACAAMLDGRRTPATPARRTRPFSLTPPEDLERLPGEIEDAYPLTLLQEGMIFHREFAAKSAVYHAIASIRLRAPFDLDVMRSVIARLVQRHPVLRTSFDLGTYSVPLQLVHRDFEDPLSFEDLRGLPPDEQHRRTAAWVAREQQRGFELNEHPLIRFMAQRLSDDSFQFTYGFHHEILDGWSEAVMVTELFGHYLSVVFDSPIAIRRPTATMRDAVALELEALESREHYDFWTRYLEGASLTRLPRLLSGLKADTGAREIVRVEVPVEAELSDALKEVARGQAVPLKTVLLAAHMAVMSTYGGGADTLSYTVTNGRPEDADGSTSLGLFVNSLAVRIGLGGGSWAELIAGTFAAEQASLAHRRLPMAELKRHQGNEPLAECLFFFTDYHVFDVLDHWRERGVAHVASELYGESTFPFCAIFRLHRATGQLEVRIEYDSLQFPSELIDAIRDSYQVALDAIAADPGAGYHVRELLGAGEGRRALEAGESAAVDGEDQCLHQLFEAVASRQPDAVALRRRDQTITYGELDRRAERVARVLRAAGVGPETRVGVHATRSPATVAALLGVLKAGGAYVAVDPAWPRARAEATLAHARVEAVVAEAGANGPPAPAGAVSIDLTAAMEPPGPAAPPPPAARVHPAGAAYVMYTSGSTGEPKGVVVEHRAAVASTRARDAVYGDEPERFLLLSSLAVDSSVAGLFGTLCRGGTLVLAEDGAPTEPRELVRLIRTRQVSATLAVPSLAAPLLEAAERGALRSLRTFVVAGESCPNSLHALIRRQAPGTELVNEYGPTEATVWSTVANPAAAGPGASVPIGRPIPGARVHVVDAHDRPAPVGVAGELLIGGPGIARGYLGRPGATAAAFVPDRFAAEPGARAYRTGDVSRRLLDGQLDFLGRRDEQVKVNGFRVEPGEVEAVLDAHPAVRQSVVLPRPGEDGGASLVAYVVGANGGAPTSDALAGHLRARLPAYMVPLHWVTMDALPLTAAGKVDRRSLTPPAARHEAGAAEYVAPATQVEEILTDVWRRVLRRERVGVQDDFFAAGGESLRAMQATTTANRLFGVDLSVRALFEARNVRALAQRVEAAKRSSRGGNPRG